MGTNLLTDAEELARRFPVEAGLEGWRTAEQVLQIELNTGDLHPPELATGALGWLTARMAPAIDIVRDVTGKLGASYTETAFDLAQDWLYAQLTAEELRERHRLIDVYFPQEVNYRAALEALLKLPFVNRIVPVPQDLPPMAAPGSVRLPDEGDEQDLQWYLERCRVDAAWPTATGKGVVIADVDFGFLTTHVDLTNIEPAAAFNSADGSSNVSFGEHIRHGTAVLGIAGGAKNAAGMVGMAFDSRLWPIQANAGAGPRIPGQKWARAIDHVRAADASGRRKVLILEVQTGKGRSYEMVPAVNLAIRQAISHGVVVVAAAGNGKSDVRLDDDNQEIPETGAILVGATVFHPTENPLGSFSNFGERITVSAPGDPGQDLTCDGRGTTLYRTGFGGTSGAAPKVAGACALMLEKNPRLTHHAIKAILSGTGSVVTTTADRPAGTFLDIAAAVEAV